MRWWIDASSVSPNSVMSSAAPVALLWASAFRNTSVSPTSRQAFTGSGTRGSPGAAPRQ